MHLNKSQRNALLHCTGGTFLATLLTNITLETHILRKLLFVQRLVRTPFPNIKNYTFLLLERITYRLPV
jgi:hypothetical protein